MNTTQPYGGKYYLKYSRATDTHTSRDYALYRFFEILPGAIVWITLAGIIFLSWFLPVWASIFIIVFDTYWLLKTLFFSIHLRVAFSRMRRNMKINWKHELEKLSLYPSELKISSWKDIRHLIIIPFYKEPYEVIRSGLESIRKSNYPLENLFVILAREERAGDDAKKNAERLAEEYTNVFGNLIITVHPENIPGEMAGKGSNESWAVKEAVNVLVQPQQIPFERVMVSSFDVDTNIYPDYFGRLTHAYLTAARPLRASYQPVPVYNNNIWQAPAFSRVVAASGTFWQMMQQARPERLATFSSHSIPLAPLAEMNYWHVNMVSEDSRIFWQALIYYDGDYEVVPLHYPISMDANMGETTMQTFKNVYKQQRRWIWGAENIPYLLFGFVKNKHIPFSKKIFFGFNQLEGFWSIGTNALMIFLLGWLPITIGGISFGVTVLAWNLPKITRSLMTAAMVGLIASAIYSLQLLPPRPKEKPRRFYVWVVLQWLLIPITLIVFNSIPGIDAMTRLMLGRYMGFWVTPKVRK